MPKPFGFRTKSGLTIYASPEQALACLIGALDQPTRDRFFRQLEQVAAKVSQAQAQKVKANGQLYGPDGQVVTH